MSFVQGLVEKIDVKISSEEIFEIFKNDQYTVILDSSLNENRLGRYSVVLSDPFLVFKSKGEAIEIAEKGVSRFAYGNPLDWLRDLLNRYKTGAISLLPCINGCCAGFISYDLGRVCKIGSVKVDRLFQLEKYSTVFHLVSTVTGELRDGMDVIDLIKASFPGGSITGAPKIRAMEIIDELEPCRRNIYTGAIGYMGFDGESDLNIAIRTIVIKDGEAFYSVGGRIVWDSVPEKEYQETLYKGMAMMRVLNPRG